VGAPVRGRIPPRKERTGSRPSPLQRCRDLQPHDTAGKLPIGPLLFTVPYAKWSHYDDAIDYYEETQRTVRADGGVPDRCAIINRLRGSAQRHLPLRQLLCPSSKWEASEAAIHGRPLVAYARPPQPRFQAQARNEFGVKTLVDWQRHIVPEAPLFIRAFCECFEIFKAPKTIWRLRPMLYTYWC